VGVDRLETFAKDFSQQIPPQYGIDLVKEKEEQKTHN
jgi:hypothetical protein